MYITYADDWSKLKEVFHLIDTFQNWSRATAAPTTGPITKPPGETD